jgi:hypothetical protein
MKKTRRRVDDAPRGGRFPPVLTTLGVPSVAAIDACRDVQSGRRVGLGNRRLLCLVSPWGLGSSQATVAAVARAAMLCRQRQQAEQRGLPNWCGQTRLKVLQLCLLWQKRVAAGIIMAWLGLRNIAAVSVSPRRWLRFRFSPARSREHNRQPCPGFAAWRPGINCTVLTAFL